MWKQLLVACAFWQAALQAQSENQALTRAYEALHVKAYEVAVVAFQEAIVAAPARPDIRKDLAYTYLKIGEDEAARQQFKVAMELAPADQGVALEFAFLTFESRTDPVPSKALARRIFDGLRKKNNATAERAFQNIDMPLQEGISRWTKALEVGPPSFSVHYELAQLYEERDELSLAATQYLKAHEINRSRFSVLLDLARVYEALKLPKDSLAALLAASRCGEPRTAETARGLLPTRYPYVYEFRKAVQLDRGNNKLHRELAYLLLAMKDLDAAIAEFKLIVVENPEDLLSKAQLDFLIAADPEIMAERSLKAGYLKDALRYLSIAQETHPDNYAVMLKLGWAYNMLHDDRAAVSWFNLARKSPDPAVAVEASRAYENLRPETKLFRTTAWILPFYSTRWHDAFAYGQIKTELNTGRFKVRPYLSLRLIADAKPTGQNQPLSEKSFIAGLGLATQWKRFVGWAEAGSAINYTTGSMKPDYRGGVSWARGWASKSKLFVEANTDEVFISRFGNDWLSYVQSRFGFRWVFMNANLTADTNREHWANFVEIGPGIRFHVPDTPKNLLFSVNYLRGKYLMSDGDPTHSSFSDLRVGFWYAITK